MPELQRWVDRRSALLPDYALFPQVRDWNDLGATASFQALKLKRGEHLSLYIHLPFCEELCVFCGCNVVVSRRANEIERAYLDLLKSEVESFCKVQLAQDKIKVDKIYVGGGSPNFFSALAMEDLSKVLKNSFDLSATGWNFELDPRKTSQDQVETLQALGNVHLQWGVQDMTTRVQKKIFREVSKDTLYNLMKNSSKSLSHGVDLLWGLPGQDEREFVDHLEDLANYPISAFKVFRYIDPPWNKPGQRYFSSESLMSDQEIFSGLLAIEKELGRLGWFHLSRGAFFRSELKEKKVEGSVYLSGWCPETTVALKGFGVGAASSFPWGHTLAPKAYPLYEKWVLKAEAGPIRTHLWSAREARVQKEIIQCLASGRLSLVDLDLEETERSLLAIFQEEGWLKLTSEFVTVDSPWFWPWVFAVFDSRLIFNGETFVRRDGA